MKQASIFLAPGTFGRTVKFGGGEVLNEGRVQNAEEKRMEVLFLFLTREGGR